jgi:hypothetical protein
MKGKVGLTLTERKEGMAERMQQSRAGQKDNNGRAGGGQGKAGQEQLG